MSEHEIQYLAGLGGRTDPGWRCSCGGWGFPAVPMPRRRTGNNKIEAERSFTAHVERAGAETDDWHCGGIVWAKIVGGGYNGVDGQCCLPTGHEGGCEC